MNELQARTRRVAGSRLLDLCNRYAIKSLVDPFMGLPTHLNVLKRHGIIVHGGDLVDWFVRAGEGLVVNDFTYLRESEVADIVEMLPGRIYPTDLFRAWEGVFFTEEQCAYLGVWHANVHDLRSDGQTGLAVAGLWHVLCYWLEKARHTDAMQDVPPSELAWRYLRETEQWVTANNARNTVRRGDYESTLRAARADAVYVLPPGRTSGGKTDPRVWMWEAWWHGDPYLNVERYYRDTAFGSRTIDDASYDKAIATVVEAADTMPVVILQTSVREADRLAKVLRNYRLTVEIEHPSDDETFVIGRR